MKIDANIAVIKRLDKITVDLCQKNEICENKIMDYQIERDTRAKERSMLEDKIM